VQNLFLLHPKFAIQKRRPLLEVSKSLREIPLERIEQAILVVRGEKVIIDNDLAKLYGVSTSRLNEQVKRNRDRFPADFAFRLTTQEFTDLISQSATSSSKHGGPQRTST
jgi:hypothetical protein